MINSTAGRHGSSHSRSLASSKVVKGCGTTDYGAAMSFKIHDVLEQRDEILVVSLDVKGAFDRVWWLGSRTGWLLEV